MNSQTSYLYSTLRIRFCVVCCVVILGMFGAQAQSFEVIWPQDVFNGNCNQSIAELAQLPEVISNQSCDSVNVIYVDEYLEPLCPQETWVNRSWSVIGCGDTLTHVQQIRLVDDESPSVVFDDSYTGHFCASSLDWLPNVQDNCDASLTGGFGTSDTLLLCDGVMTFSIALNISDDCGNVLDTSYVVYLHSPCDTILSPVLPGCTDPLAISFNESATCDDGSCVYGHEMCGAGTVYDVDLGVCVSTINVASGQDFCGPWTVWDPAQELCIPVFLGAACYFDTDGSGEVGTGDLLNFLGVYGAPCDYNP